MKFKLLPLAALCAVAGIAIPQAASASLVYDSTLFLSAQGFGTAPKDLTLKAPNNDTFESGAVGVSSTGAITFGSPISDAAVHDGNSVSTASGTASLPSPLADNQKYGIPTISSLGITSASQIGILFNSTDPAGNSLLVNDVTLKFYTSGGSFLGAIDGQQNFANTFPGTGSAGFVFKVSNDELAYVNGLLSLGGTSTTLALEGSISGVGGGTENFAVVNIGAVGPVPEPETYALMMAGLGVVGFVARRRKRA